MATLLITSAGFEGRVIKLKLGTNRIGRAPDNDVQIEHPTISANHCEIEVQLDGLILRDRDSTNGTFIDGQPIAAARLLSGRSFQLGEVELMTESAEIAVHIPHFQVALEALPPVVLEDGSLICPRHPQTPSTYHCLHCREIMCDGCVRRIGRRGGKVYRLCPKCSHHCERLGGEKRKKKRFFDFLKKTVGIAFAE